jgi:hypothetical protein
VPGNGMINKSAILKKLKSDGICVIPNYWSYEKCNIAIQEINKLKKSLFEKGQGGDIRCQHSNKYLKTSLEFMNDKFIQGIANEYSSCSLVNRTVLGVVQHDSKKNIDSGGGWHVDSIDKSQFKSFLYLTNVTTKSGPFTFIQSSKEKVSQLETYSNFRIKESDIQNFKAKDIIEVCGSSGTLILADTSNVHRGKIIKEGTRMSYTTYFYERSSDS